MPLSAPAATRGKKSVGIRAGYTTGNSSAVAGLYFQYAFSERFRIAPDADYTFRHEGTDAFSINLNAHVPFDLGTSRRWEVYPLAGLNYTSWNIHRRSSLRDNDDSKSRVDRLGFNAGAGIGFHATPTLKFALEGKYRWTRHYNSGVFTLSIGYMF